ncbi:MAG: MFS transporter [Spirochaetota bacterium]
MGDKDRGFKTWFGTTFLIGFGFFSMGLMDPLYDTYAPIFLGKYIPSMTLVGSIMTIDNVFALFLIPIVTFFSDRTRTRWGRRMPWIAVTLPLTALCFGYLPYAAEISFGILFATIVVMNVWKQSARGPVVALMPDIVPGAWRSEANGIINMMGGIASIVGTIGLARLMNLDAVLPLLGATKNRIPFPIAGLLVLVAVVLLIAFVRESKEGMTAETSEKRIPLWKSLREIRGAGDRSIFWIFASLIAWFLAYQGILPFIGRYSMDVLGASMGNAALPAGMVGIAYALFALPSGYLAHRIGRRRVIRIALAALVIILGLLFVFEPFSAALGLVGGARFALFLGLMFSFGVFWVSIVTNSFPMLWQLSNRDNVGIFTGLYYIASQSAAIAAPPITGAIIDLGGFPGIFGFAALGMVLAFIGMGFVKKGEAA